MARRICLGEKNPKAKLCEDDVRLIRALAKEQVKANEIAEKFGVTRSCIKEILEGRNWVHVA